jgi:hypothetical protein
MAIKHIGNAKNAHKLFIFYSQPENDIADSTDNITAIGIIIPGILLSTS